jgi:hypothetical protein
MSAIGLEIALSSIILVLVVSYFFSQNEKSRSVSMGYLDKKEATHLDEYADILDRLWNSSEEKKKDKNMSLPI